MLSVAMAGFTALAGAGTDSRATAAHPAPQVREIADATLRDVAVAVYDPAHPVIYYNPRLMEKFTPDLRAFFLAHEHAHIELRHTRASALRADPAQRDELLQGKELEADCLAARRLGTAGRASALAAVRFFARLGSQRYDSEHPTGRDRAVRILACMPE
jgi:Zn-dependent protease with chaperone function